MSFGLQYPRATTKAWLHATMQQWCLANFVFAPLKLWFFAVTVPALIRGKLRRIRPPKRTADSFPFRAPMRDSAVEYLAARHVHPPVAKFLLNQSSHSTSEDSAQPTPLHRATRRDEAAESEAKRPASASSPSSEATTTTTATGAP